MRQSNDPGNVSSRGNAARIKRATRDFPNPGQARNLQLTLRLQSPAGPSKELQESSGTRTARSPKILRKAEDGLFRTVSETVQALV